MSKTLDHAIKMRESGNVDEAIHVLKELLSTDPKNAILNYQCAWCHDLLGKEIEAIPYYESAIDNGLSGEDLEGAFLGLGSTYRVVGEYEKSRMVFEKGIRLFPLNLELRAFYAMTLYNLNEHSKSMEILLKIIADTSNDDNVKKYSKAISFYSDKLDQVW